MGDPTPFFPKTHRNLDLGMGKKYTKREGNKLSIGKNRKNPHFFPMMRRNLDLGMEKYEKMGKKVYGKGGKSIRLHKLLYIIIIVFCILFLNKIFRVP